MNKKITKKSHNSIENKLKAYSALAAGLIAFTNNSEAQIVYKDIKPDTIIPLWHSYLLDLNGDGTNDFELKQVLKFVGSYSSSNRVEIYPLGNGNRILDTLSAGNHYPPALALNTSIGPNININKKLAWTSSKDTLLTLNFAFAGSYSSSNVYKGYWQGVTDKYLGLSIEVNNKTYYGWIRLDVAKDAKSFTIKSYAYDSIPNQTVFAGDTVKTNINKNPDLLGLKTIIYTHNKDLYVNLNNDEPITGTINLFTLTGQLLRTTEIATDENHIKLESIASGIYILNVKTPKGNLTKKVQIE